MARTPGRSMHPGAASLPRRVTAPSRPPGRRFFVCGPS
ncbi:hypothetical protein Ga0080559_TMP3328 [Salipiger profundus]|uniref:Uncharacterized protein n=1 Tax=Salipiger profundus TaxID=1229727 RepID=A0A1U7D7I1_9RHOB|nr:hypothetical protein Ga0080559_TMP3328 [Salipiger profundus]